MAYTVAGARALARIAVGAANVLIAMSAASAFAQGATNAPRPPDAVQGEGDELLGRDVTVPSDLRFAPGSQRPGFQQPGSRGEPDLDTSAEIGGSGASMAPAPGAPRESSSLLRNERFGVRPQAGSLLYGDGTTDSARFLLGFIADWNIAQTLWPRIARDWFVGPSTGFLFAHLSDAGASFFGAEPGGFQAKANFFEVPINLKMGYAVSSGVRLSLHGGGNLVYRSVTSAVLLGDRAGLDRTALFFPNLGADAEFALAQNLLLTLRPDWTLGSQDRIFSGTVGVAFGFS